MAKSLSFGRVDIGLTPDPAAAHSKPTPETPFCIAVLGDFSGRGARPGEPPAARLADRRPRAVDRDNLDEVLAKVGPTLRLPAGVAGDAPLELRFGEVDDFLPDRLYERLDVFRALRELRTELANPATFAAAAERIRGWAPAEERPAAPAAKPPAPAPPPGDPADLLDQILGGAPQRPPTESAGGTWDSLLRQIVQPHLLPRTDYARQAQLLAVVDEAAARQMRALLHHPDFQAVEAAWRAVAFLTRRLDTGPELRLSLLDVAKAELATDLASADDPAETGLYRLLADRAEGDPPWAVVAGLYAFGPEDADVLGRLARLARRAGAPFLAEASSRLVGCESLARTPDPSDWQPPESPDWEALRRLPEAAYVGLALPRFLLRLPYGKESAPAEAFDFEELPGGGPHEGYLWGNPAAACACLLGEAFARDGWGLRPDAHREVTGLPVHLYREEGESRATPCAEAVLGERAAEAILDRGLMPLLSVRGRDAVRLGRFQSLADPPAPLAGPWG
jgi:type VI secretion system protein ImpC